jgi:hypothetical protein
VTRINWASYWCYYEVNLLGDPALEIWTAEPLVFTPVYSPLVTIGSTQFDVTVGVPGASVSFSGPNGVMGYGLSNAEGIATVYVMDPVTVPGDFILSITKHNYLPYDGLIRFTNSVGPYPVIMNPCFIDTLGGDGDGLADLGESLNFDMTFQNTGIDTGFDLQANFECLDNCVSIDPAYVYLGNLAPNSSLVLTDVFRAILQPSVRDSQALNFQVTITDRLDSSWVANFNILAHAPDLHILSWNLLDGVDNRLSPGDSATLQVKLKNLGSSETTDLSLLLSTDNPLAQVISCSITLPPLDPGDTISTAVLQITVNSAISDPSVLMLYLSAQDTRDYQQSFMMECPVGGIHDDMESGAGSWTHESVTPTFVDEWNLSMQSNHSLGGSHSWHCGVSPQYAPLMDAGLVTEEFALNGAHVLHFWHWMMAQVNAQIPGSAYDGGILEMSLNGAPFAQVTPQGGYPKVISSSTQPGPFAPGTPCWSGTFTWQQVAYNVTGEGTVCFRFRFGSDGSGGSIGWFVDDLEFVKTSTSNPPQNLEASAAGPMITLTWNTPSLNPPAVGQSGHGSLNPPQIATLEYYRIYREGALIDSIQALSYTDNLTGLSPGNFGYQVSGIFDGVEGPLSPPAYVQYTGMNQLNPEALPTETALRKIYPNPFNASTAIRFELSTAAQVTLTVYDLQGRNVGAPGLRPGSGSTGNQGAHHAPLQGWYPAGKHEISFEASNLPSGIYFVAMRAGDYSAVMKMVLLK